MMMEAQREGDPGTWEQSFSAVVRELPVGALRRMPREAAWDLYQGRERSIRDMAEDPYACGWEPGMWRKMLLWLARKRLELPNRVLVFYVLGGMRSGKTDVGGKRLAQHVAAYERLTPVGQYKVWAWGIHQNEKRSQDLGQKRAHDYLPRAWRDAKFTKKMGAAFSFFPGKGFTGNQFVVDGRLCQFMFAGMDPTVLQGPELTFAWLDEELPPSICTTVEERLSTHAAQAGNRRHLERVMTIKDRLEAGVKIRPDEIAALHLGVCLHTFTPKEGWTKVVADALNGAETLEEEVAPALPVYGPVQADGTREVLEYLKAPRVKQCKDAAKMIFYIWTQDNPFGGYEALLGTYANKTEAERRVALYGDVQKDWKTAYPRYEFAKHVRKLAEVPRDVTVRRYVDAAEARPLFTVWIGTDRVGRDYVLNEWPREGDYIPGVGDPGAWAEPSAGDKKDGDAGAAQKLIWFGYRDYINEWERVERQLAAWKAGVDDPFSLSPEELKKHDPVKLYEEQMDSRLGNAPTMTEGGKSTMMDDFNDLGCDFVPAAGDRLKEGDSKMNDALRGGGEEDAEKGRGQGHGLFAGPRLLVCEHCLAVRFMLENYTGLDGSKGACKDPRDAVVFHLTNDDRGYKEEVEWSTSVRGRGAGRGVMGGIGDWR